MRRKIEVDIDIGSRIRELREEYQIKLTKLAEDVGISKSHLSAIELGKIENPTVGILLRIADSLGTSVAYILGETDDARKIRVSAELAIGEEVELLYEVGSVIPDIAERMVGIIRTSGLVRYGEEYIARLREASNYLRIELGDYQKRGLKIT
jgi:transcriptional regulator with XRE-family HTH domain